MGSEGRLLVWDHGLDLNDQHDASRRMPRDEIDRSSFPADPERDLRGNLPTREAKGCRDEFDESSVGGIDQAVEGFAVPAEAKIGSGSKRAGNSIHLRQRDVACLPCLDAHDH